MHHVSTLGILFHALEQVIGKHAKQNTKWWREHNQSLRTHQEISLRHLYIAACAKNIRANISGLQQLLTDRELLRYGQLNYELGQLMNEAYPLLDCNTWTTNQHTLLSLYNDIDEEDNAIWANRRIQEWLDWIPACCRTKESQNHLERHTSLMSPPSRTPEITSWSGWVASPFSHTTLLDFSDDGIIDLLRHYQSNQTRTHHEELRSIGGKEQVLRTLKDAASSAPTRFLGLLPRLRSELDEHEFSDYALDGIADHLHHTIGRYSSNKEWAPIEQPEPTALAEALLQAIDRQPGYWRGKRETGEALLACSGAHLAPEYTKTTIFHLYGMLTSDEPRIQDSDNNGSGLISSAINSDRGRAAEAAINLLNRLLEEEASIPDLLFQLLKHFAKDENPAIGAILLRFLPYTIYKSLEQGWELFRTIMSHNNPDIWPYTEQCLYHHYHSRYTDVAPWLNQLKQNGMEHGGETWGRISALCALCGHINLEQFLTELISINSNTAIKGAIAVFSHNINDRKCHMECQLGLQRLLSRESVSKPDLDRSGSRYFCGSLFWASKPKQAANT